MLARRDVPDEVHDEVLVARAHAAGVEEPAEVLAEGRRRLEILLAPAQDHALAADVLEDVQDARQVVERVRAAGGHHVDVGDHEVALGELREVLGCELHALEDLAVLDDVRHALAHDRDLAQLERVHDQLRQADVHLGLGDDADERVPVLEARPHVVEVHAVQGAGALGNDPLVGHEEVVEGDDRLDLLAARGQRMLVGVGSRAVRHLAAEHLQTRRVDGQVDPEALLVERRMERPEDQLVGLRHGGADALDAADPDARRVLLNDAGGGPLGRLGLGRGARGARAEALRVDDRLAEVDVVLLGVLDVPVDVLGELRALALEGRQLAEHAERQRGDHVDATAVRTPGAARDMLDALAAEAQVVARARNEVRGGDAGAVVADVREDVLRLRVELLVVDGGDLARCRRRWRGAS